MSASAPKFKESDWERIYQWVKANWFLILVFIWLCLTFIPRGYSETHGGSAEGTSFNAFSTSPRLYSAHFLYFIFFLRMNRSHSRQSGSLRSCINHFFGLEDSG